jgi:hypothetical protein
MRPGSSGHAAAPAKGTATVARRFGRQVEADHRLIVERTRGPRRAVGAGFRSAGGSAPRSPAKAGFRAPRRQAQAEQVVEGVHHRHQAEAGEQEDQRVAEAEVVVDGADQHHREDDGEKQPAAVGTMKMRRCPRTIGNCSSRPSRNSQRAKACEQAHQGSGCERISAAMSSASAWLPLTSDAGGGGRLPAGRPARPPAGPCLRPSVKAQARAAASSDRAARGLRPCTKRGSLRVASTSSCT